jgi:tetratricopeptide (TPR) repeat protein
MAPLLLSSFSTLFRREQRFSAMRFRGIFLILWLGLAGLMPAHAAGAADAVLAEVSAALAGGQYQAAITVAGSGLAEAGLDDLTRARLLVVRGLARQALGANDDALADFTLALSIAALPPSERARALFARGVSLDSLGRLDSAAGDYSAVLTLQPDASYALNNRANVYRRQGRLENARRDYGAALQGANPNAQYPYFGLGQIAEAQGDMEMARGYYNKALAAAPGFPLALERLQALGTPAEGVAGLPADTGVIVLKPPGARPAMPLTLHRPEDRRDQASVPGRNAEPVPQPGSTLRPTIVEGAPAQSGGTLVQLGAWRSEEEARSGWAVAQQNAGGLLSGASPFIVRAEIPGRGTFWRLRVAPRGAAAEFCARLAGRGLACIPVRG